MPGRAGGKAKPLKAKKVGGKDLSAEDIAFKKKQQEARKAEKELANKLKGGKGLVKTKVGKKK